MSIRATLPGVTVLFSVTGANPTSGSAVTDANGNATFCYVGVMLGADVIIATADSNANGRADAGEPGAAASKTWTPSTSARCGEVDAEGFILSAGGKGHFNVDAQSGVGHPSTGGHVVYFDMGTANKKLSSVTISGVVIVDASHAEIFGVGKVNGGSAQPFRVDVNHAAAGDRFSIMWAGYSAAGPLVKGKVEIDAKRCEARDHNHDGGDDGNGHNGGDSKNGD